MIDAPRIESASARSVTSLRRQARSHQSRREGGEGRTPLRLPLRWSSSAIRRAGVGFGHGKAREVPEAIRKATDSAKRDLPRVPLREGRTLHHDVAGPSGRRPGPPARSASRHRHHRRRPDARACSRRSACRTWWRSRSARPTPYNMVRATFDALKRQDSPRLGGRRAATSRCPRCRRAASGGDAEVVAE